MNSPSEQHRAQVLAEAEAQAATDPEMAALLSELDEAVTAAERRVARAPLRRRPGPAFLSMLRRIREAKP
jgi:hypothetical protein